MQSPLYGVLSEYSGSLWWYFMHELLVGWCTDRVLRELFLVIYTIASISKSEARFS